MAAFVFLLHVPVGLARTATVVWTAPTKPDQTRFTVPTGSKFSLKLVASTSAPKGAVAIEALDGVPIGANIELLSGKLAQAVFSWAPRASGEYVVRFGASAGAGISAPTLTYTFDVRNTDALAYPRSYALTDERIAQSAIVLTRVVAHAKPTRSSRVITTLGTATSDGTPNLVLVLDAVDQSPTATWYHVRLPILPNNSTAWVPASALGELTKVRTHLYVDRAKMTATVERNGVPIFKTSVGVGKSEWPTPAGEYYVLNKLTDFENPAYGPVAFGTSARSPTLTDWPGGGFIAVHGTDQPQLLPGKVSHGCIRMPNAAILKLARLMEPGTPLTIS